MRAPRGSLPMGRGRRRPASQPGAPSSPDAHRVYQRLLWAPECPKGHRQTLKTHLGGQALPRILFATLIDLPMVPLCGVFPGGGGKSCVRLLWPGPKHLFDGAAYVRGAMTLHRLRLAVGNGNFFEILRRWAASRSGDNVTTGQFIRLAEEVSGKNLDGLFNRWLFKRRSQGCSGHQGSREVRRSPRSRFDPIF